MYHFLGGGSDGPQLLRVIICFRVEDLIILGQSMSHHLGIQILCMMCMFMGLSTLTVRAHLVFHFLTDTFGEVLVTGRVWAYGFGWEVVKMCRGQFSSYVLQLSIHLCLSLIVAWQDC